MPSLVCDHIDAIHLFLRCAISGGRPRSFHPFHDLLLRRVANECRGIIFGCGYAGLSPLTGRLSSISHAERALLFPHAQSSVLTSSCTLGQCLWEEMRRPAFVEELSHVLQPMGPSSALMSFLLEFPPSL